MTEITVNANVSINTMTYEDIQNFMLGQQKAILSVMSKEKWMTCEEILAAYRKNGGNYYTSPAGIAAAFTHGISTNCKVEWRKQRIYYYTCLCDEFGNPLGDPIKHCTFKPQYRLR